MYSTYLGDSLELMSSFQDESFDHCICDPPYGLSSEDPDMLNVLQHWTSDKEYLHNKSGFMSAPWDSQVPGPKYWREVHRLLKPGGYLLAFGGTRTFDFLSLAISLSGLEIVQELAFIYGKGFPKSLDLGKHYDHLKGYGTGLKPSNEPIILAQKSPTNHSPIENPVFYGAKVSPGERMLGCEELYWDSGHRRVTRVEWESLPEGERRRGNIHPTVKTTALMSWCVSLVASPGQVVLDPFMGSGSTGVACLAAGVHFHGIDLEPAHVEIANARLQHTRPAQPTPSPLFR
jgi:DNA modification methylase